jgi:hypothetical protein
MQLISRQRIGKHVPAATNTYTTIEILLETVFSTRSVQSGFKEDNWGDPVSESRLRRDSAIVSCQLSAESSVLRGRL